MSVNRPNAVSDHPSNSAKKEIIPAMDSGQTPVGCVGEAEGQPDLDAHVVLLNNYVRPHHVAAYTELAKRVRRLTVLLSVPMEPDRHWQPQWNGLDVRVQKNWMFTTRWKHSSGFAEPNFIHIPIDTTRQLKDLNADIVFSYEMGMRTFLSCWYRRFHPQVPLVMVGNMSEHVEAERGWARKILRRAICRGVDYYTYNGPSCKRYLETLAVPESRLFEIPYCIDSSAVYTGPRVASTSQERRLLYCGALSDRKGIVQFTQALARWCRENPTEQVRFAIAGDGPRKSAVAELANESLTIDFLGQCDRKSLSQAYRDSDMAVFPSLADEWGLVPIEAMASGLPVLGSFFAQSMESHCEEGENGWTFDPTNKRDLECAVDRAMACSLARLAEMGNYARQSVAHVTPQRSADHFCKLIQVALPNV